MPVQFYQSGECRLAYETWGEGDALIFCHGFGLTRESMRSLAERLDRGRRVVLLDWRGHGATTCPPDDSAFSYPLLRDDLLALMDHLGIDRAHLIGHSMGGQIALMAAIEQPDRVLSLVTLGAGPCRKVTDPKEEKNWRRSAAFFETADQPSITKALLGAAGLVDPLPAAIDGDALFGEARGADLARMIRGAFLNVESNDDACGKIVNPTLILVGENDATWLEASRKLHGLIAGSELREIAGAAHLVHLERPGEVTLAIEDFHRRQDLASSGG